MASPNLAAIIAANPAAAAELANLRMADKQNAIASQRVRSSLYYWSKFRIAGTVTTGTLKFAQGKRSAFSYTISATMTSAGFSAADGTATDCETNLESAAATVAGESVTIVGVGIQLAPDTDAELARRVSAHTCARIARGAGAAVKLGPIAAIPGGGGLHGGGNTRVLEPPQNAAAAQASAIGNGYPSSLNYRALPEPMIWTPQGTTDGILTVEIDLVRDVTLTLPAVRAATSGISAYAQPATGDPGTYLDGWVFLITDSERPRGQNF
jgi:hypothetical protein